MAKERVARGVRKVNETITQEGRALVLTEKEADNLLWDDIPAGSIRVNNQTGAWSVKVEDQSDWVPGGIKNDGTLNVIKDTKVSVETFIIKQLEVPGTKREFTYYYDSQEDDAHIRHGIILYKNALGMCGEYGQYGTYPTWTECKKYLILDNNVSENQYKNTQKVGYVFSLEQGDYAMYRNHLKIAIDDVLHRSVKSGGIKEVSETRFCLTEDYLEDGMEITAEYIHAFRLGNPYPRTFVNPNEPERSAAEVGDFWLDTDGTLADDDPLGDYIEDDGMIDWSRIRPNTRPSSIAGYGIKDKLSYEGHPHVPADVLGIEKVKVDNAKHADSADLATDATNAVNANYATSAGTAREAAKATKADNANLATRALNADNAANATKAKNAEKAANADNAAEANHAATATNATNAANANEAKHAATASKADNATRATNADNAANANRAKEADHAATATRATNADNAANANHALIADRAIKADTATRATNADNAKEAAHAASATSANTATTASTATVATRAKNADNATNAKEANHAASATTATNADNAANATNAKEANHAASATKADLATKATNDGNGRNIVNTYALKSELNAIKPYLNRAPSVDYSKQIFGDASSYHNGIPNQYGFLNTLHDIKYTAKDASQVFISIGTVSSPNFEIQHMIFLNDILIYKGTSCFISFYLNPGDVVEVRVRRGTDPDGYKMLTGVLNDGQNCSATMAVYGMKVIKF